jgi:TRAP-type transport system small permease protein
MRMTCMQLLSLLGRGLEKILRVLVMLLAAGLIVVIAYQVFGRYVLLRAPRWSEELARILMIWMSFLGAALLIRYKRSIQVEFLVSKFARSEGARLSIWALNTSITLFFAAFMLYWGYRLALFGRDTTTDTIRIPLYFVTGSIPVGGLCMIIFLLEEISEKARQVFLRSQRSPR